MPAVTSCLRCCRKCGRPSARQRHVVTRLPRPHRSLHSTAVASDDLQQLPSRRARQDRDRDSGLGLPGHDSRRRQDRPDDEARKINMGNKFRLADKAAQDGPIVLKNFEMRNHIREKPRRLQPSDPAREEVQELWKTMKQDLGQQEPDETYRLEDMVRDIDALRTSSLHYDQARRRKQGLMSAEVSKRRPRYSMSQDNTNAQYLILYATYARVAKDMTSTYTQEQLAAYAQDFSNKTDRSMYQGATDMSSILLFGQGLHMGWRPAKPGPEVQDHVMKQTPWLRLPSGQTRSLRSFADKVIRSLWGFEVEEEINSRGTLIHNVDSTKAPFFAGRGQQAARALISNMPDVDIEISSKGDCITLLGSKYDCFDAERILRNNVEEVVLSHLDMSSLLGDGTARKSLDAETVKSLVNACGCVLAGSVTQDKLCILGPSKVDVDECMRAILATVEFPTRLEHSIQVGEFTEEVAAHADHQAVESLSWSQRQKLLGRFAGAVSLKGDRAQTNRLKAQLQREVSSIESRHAAAAASDVSHLNVAGWKTKTLVTAETGRILHELKDLRPKVKQLDSVKPSNPSTTHFVSNLTGLPQTLTTQARTFTGPSGLNKPFSRLRLMGRPLDTQKSIKRAPWLEIDIRHDKNGVPLIDVVRLIVHTITTDVMLPDLATDLRVTTTKTLEVANVARSPSVIDFIRKLQLQPGGRFLSPWSLRLSIPSYTTTEEIKSVPTDLRTSKTKKTASKNTQHTETEGVEPEVTEIDFFPVTLEDIETTHVTFRMHDLEINTINGGGFGEHVEGIRLRMTSESSPEKLQEAAVGSDLVESDLDDDTFDLSSVHDENTSAGASVTSSDKNADPHSSAFTPPEGHTVMIVESNPGVSTVTVESGEIAHLENRSTVLDVPGSAASFPAVNSEETRTAPLESPGTPHSGEDVPEPPPVGTRLATFLQVVAHLVRRLNTNLGQPIGRVRAPTVQEEVKESKKGNDIASQKP